LFTEELITKAAQGDVSALVELDRRGLLLGATESCEQYAERLRRLQANIAEMDAELTEHGHFRVEGMKVDAAARIQPHVFDTARATTERLFGFAIDWVPGFFVNPSQSWLFGACAFYFYPDFFALFVVRKSFADREKWLIYSRRELLAHELCHIARIGFGSRIFEENFAYQTSTSGFRRVVGSVSRSPRDSQLLLGSVFLLLAASTLQVVWLPSFWVWPFWLTLLGVLGFFAKRLLGCRRLFNRALGNLSILTAEHALAMLFRCSDHEVEELAGLRTAQQVGEWVANRVDTSVRWRVTATRFVAPSSVSTMPSTGSQGTIPPAGPAVPPAVVGSEIGTVPPPSCP